MRTLLNIFWLGLKEIASLLSDLVMVIFLILLSVEQEECKSVNQNFNIKL